MTESVAAFGAYASTNLGPNPPSRKDRLSVAVFSCCSGRKGVNPVTAKNLVIYARQGIAYNRIKKSGNSSMLLYLNDAISQQPLDHFHSYNRAKNQAIELGKSVRQLLRSPVDLLNLRRCHFFTVFRHPETRLLSAFLDKVASGRSSRYSRAAGFGDASPAGFHRFVDYLDQGGLYHDGHWWPQVDLLAFSADQFDAIYRLEDLSQWLPALLASKGLSDDQIDTSQPHRIECQFMQEGKPVKIQRAATRLDDFFTPALRQRVAVLYAKDFLVGGYSPNLA